MNIRLNKIISDSGLCSRRKADTCIEQGRVTVNGKTAEMGTKVGPNDIVKVDGHIIKHENEAVYIVLNKPAGITCTTDQTESDNIVDFVNYPTRIFNIGRLDKPSEGLILLTNDGDIVNKILRASNNHEKEYEVVVNKSITEEFATKMATGVPILGTMTRKCKFEKEGDNRFRITLTQGLNRQIRRMCEALGYEVLKLKRVRVMNITLDKLPLGQWRFLTGKEIEVLMDMIKDSDGTPKSKSSKSSKSSKPAQKSSTGSYKSEHKSSSKPKPRGSRPYKAAEPKSPTNKRDGAKPSRDDKRDVRGNGKPANSTNFKPKGTFAPKGAKPGTATSGSENGETRKPMRGKPGMSSAPSHKGAKSGSTPNSRGPKANSGSGPRVGKSRPSTTNRGPKAPVRGSKKR